MKRIQNYQNKLATLYLISTPIGNLEDITFRALRMLKEVDKLYAEDTRVSSKLLSHFDIKRSIDSLHEHNEREKTETIINDLALGLSVGLISDQGTPLISDPGYYLVKKVIDAGYNVVSIPGANALIAALTMSGLPPYPFLFFGFLSAKRNERRKELATLQYRKETLIFYEAPHRLLSCLEDMDIYFSKRHVVIVREISKKYEEIIIGYISELKALTDIRGEIVIIVEGYQENIETSKAIDLTQLVEIEILDGLSMKDAVAKVAEITGLKKNKVYQDYLEKKAK